MIWKANGFVLTRKPLSKWCSKRREGNPMRRIRIGAGNITHLRMNETKPVSSAPETSDIRGLIMNEFARWHANNGALETAIPDVILYRYSAPTEPAPIF